MKPEDYITRLAELRRELQLIGRNIEESSAKMEERLYTGYEYKEEQSKQALLVAIRHTKTVKAELELLSKSNIEY